ncbi:PadR family transcriptional regulator [Echinicola jeungdonensis]|uniref:PadR family transcriptional regulator n=1 Tax=Echinicola jeungdonensis TaxID=709343 RepID=A0ABV5J1A0_9BACT|nr:PadR family transcriptional regulator [Echinicola jeungdonensis]MDN3668440.1 PadR family transcriptional regulator [Echinicola jeungdonensis]
MKTTNTSRQMRKGILEFCTLHIISRGEVFASDMSKELMEANLISVEGILYPLLNKLCFASLISYKWADSASGPPKKYYSLTKSGRNLLYQLETTWKELVTSTNKITSKS